MNSIVSFFKTPMNQLALATILGDIVAVLQGTMTWEHAVPFAVGALVMLIVPDNAAIKDDVEQIATDVIAAIEAKQTPATKA